MTRRAHSQTSLRLKTRFIWWSADLPGMRRTLGSIFSTRQKSTIDKLVTQHKVTLGYIIIQGPASAT